MYDDEQYAFDPTPPFGMGPAITTCEPRSRSNRWLVSQQPLNACSRVDTAGTLLVPILLWDDDHLTGCLTPGTAMIVRNFRYQRPGARLHTRRGSQSLYYLIKRISRAAQSTVCFASSQVLAKSSLAHCFSAQNDECSRQMCPHLDCGKKGRP